MLANAVSVLPDDVARVADVALTPASATSTLEEELDIAREFTWLVVIPALRVFSRASTLDEEFERFLLFELAVAIAFAASRRAWSTLADDWVR
jgi:hypothetical protein